MSEVSSPENRISLVFRMNGVRISWARFPAFYDQVLRPNIKDPEILNAIDEAAKEMSRPYPAYRRFSVEFLPDKLLKVRKVPRS